LNEKEWMKEVKKRLEKEIFFKDTNISFYDGKKRNNGVRSQHLTYL